jgi:hypothetical protein
MESMVIVLDEQSKKITHKFSYNSTPENAMVEFIRNEFLKDSYDWIVEKAIKNMRKTENGNCYNDFWDRDHNRSWLLSSVRIA